MERVILLRSPQEQGSGYSDGAMSLKNEDNNTTITPDPTKGLNNITDNRILSL